MISDTFSKFHPAVNMLFFAVVFVFGAMCNHPVFTAITFISAVCFYIQLKAKKATVFLIRGVLPLFVLTLLINPLFSHEGITILYTLPSGNPLTLESILYGISAAIQLTSILLWFAVFSIVMTSDKFVYLFGSIIPSLSLMLSVTLRFVPRFKAHLDTVKEVQQSLGYDSINGGIIKRVKNTIVCFSATVTWSLENAIDTADSMKNRGYGLKNRSSYSVYKWTSRDKIMLIFICFCAFVLICALNSEFISWRYFPSVYGVLLEPMTIFFEVIYAVLCFMPVTVNRKEAAIWKRLKSEI